MSPRDDFAEVIDDIMYGDEEDLLDEESDEQDNPDAPEASAPEEESPEDEDKVVEDPDEEDESEPEAEDEEGGEPSEDEADDGVEDEEPASEDEADEEAEDEPDEDEAEAESLDPDEVVFHLDDGTPVTRLEAQQGYLRQSDATRKWQEAAEIREKAEEIRDGTLSLADEISNDRNMQEFLSHHPDAYAHLLKNPEETREMLGDSEAVAEFWSEYEVLLENPGLAEKLTKQPEEATEELESQRRVRQALGIANSVQNAVNVVAEYYPDADKSQVEEYIKGLAGVPADAAEAKKDVEKTLAAYERLGNLFLTQQDGQWVVDTKLIADRFEMQADRVKAEQEEEAEKAEEHNKKVDEELKKETRTKSPDGEAPGPTPEQEENFDDLGDVMRDLSGHD